MMSDRKKSWKTEVRMVRIHLTGPRYLLPTPKVELVTTDKDWSYFVRTICGLKLDSEDSNYFISARGNKPFVGLDQLIGTYLSNNYSKKQSDYHIRLNPGTWPQFTLNHSTSATTKPSVLKKRTSKDRARSVLELHKPSNGIIKLQIVAPPPQQKAVNELTFRRPSIIIATKGSAVYTGNQLLVIKPDAEPSHPSPDIVFFESEGIEIGQQVEVVSEENKEEDDANGDDKEGNASSDTDDDVIVTAVVKKTRTWDQYNYWDARLIATYNKLFASCSRRACSGEL